MKARLLLPLAISLLFGATSFAQLPRKAYFQSTEIVTPEWRPEWYRLNRYFGLQNIGGVVDAHKSTDEVSPPAATFLIEGGPFPPVVTFKVTEDTAKEGIDFVIPSKKPVTSDSRFGDTFCWGQIPFFILDRKFAKRRTFTIELVSVIDDFGDPIPIDPARSKCTVIIYGVKVRK